MSRALASPVSRARRVWLAAALTLGLALATPAEPARAQDQTADSREVLLTEPAMTFISTTTKVCVRLKDVFVQTEALEWCETWRSSGSGFVVNPDGLVATASHVVNLEGEERQAIKNETVNRLFIAAGVLTPDPFVGLSERYTLPNPDDNDYLQGCYAGDRCQFTIRSVVQVYPAVVIAGVSTPKPLKGDVLKSTGFDRTDIAIVKVDSTNMPTAPLAASVADVESGQPVTALGFPGSHRSLPTGMTEPTKKFGRVSSIRVGAAGTGKQIQLDIRLLQGQSGGAVVNQAGRVIGLISYSILDEGTPQDGFIRTVDDIRAALKAAGVDAGRGLVDNTFERAMRAYWDHHYSAALPLFQEVLNLYDGHPLAKAYQAKAQAKAGGPEDVPVSAPGPVEQGRDLLVWLPLALAVLTLMVLVVVVFRQRRVTGERAAARPSGTRVTADLMHPAERPGPNGFTPAPVPGGSDPAAGLAPLPEPAERVVATALHPENPARDDQDRPTGAARLACLHCGAEVPGDNAYCGRCGRPV